MDRRKIILMRIKDALADKGSSYTRASVATSMVVPASRSGYAAVKRVLDWLLSLMALILLFPLFLAVAVAIAIAIVLTVVPMRQPKSPARRLVEPKPVER